MSEQTYKVVPYSIENLKQILSEYSEAAPAIINAKNHLVYFESYFGSEGVSASTIIVEHQYIDKDFLEDYSAYYVRCFQDYKRKCNRLHFFKAIEGRFQADISIEFEKFLSGIGNNLTKEKLQKAYLGFIVVKPLPQILFGRTCLVVYESDGGRRNYPVAREYKVNLFGLSLKITKSLAFQEQDSVVAACATSALWSALQGTGILFHHQIPSPVEITKAATVDMPPTDDSGGRILPNHGLNIAQMVMAIRSVGLESYSISIGKIEFDPITGALSYDVAKDNLKETIYAYLKGGIPLILGIHLHDFQANKRIGLHAVAVTGFSLEDKTSKTSTTGLSILSSSIDKLYAHDDQVGPFARMAFRENDGLLTTSWGGTDENRILAIPTVLLIPIYNKIRIPYDAVRTAIVIFNTLIEVFRTQRLIQLASAMTWDIYLSTNSDLKAYLLNQTILMGDDKKKILLRPMPRFIWRATAFVEKEPMIDLLFDATDILQGRCFYDAIEYNQGLSVFLRDVCKSQIETIKDILVGLLNVYSPESHLIWGLLEFLAEK